MIEGEWIAMADALAHGNYVSQMLVYRCERCGSPEFAIKKLVENMEMDGEEVVIHRHYIMRCLECGAIEANANVTIVPSWVWHPFREKGG